MRLVFNLENVGLGNNGGSRTIIRCAETLLEMGIDVLVYTNVPNRYNWHKPKVKIVKKRPKCDVMIATGYRSVKSTMRSRAGRKFYYVRGLELWNARESELIRSFKSLPVLVNSEWLQRYMKKKRIKSRILYPGLDTDWFKNKNTTRPYDMGLLFHLRHKTKRHRFGEKVARMLGCKLVRLNKDVKKCSPKDMAKIYNSTKVWFAPTELEGLHNPPMEAALCGCSLVCTDHPRNGMNDYAIHGETALVYPARNAKKAAKYVQKLLSDPKLAQELNANMVNLLLTKIGDRKTNMGKLIRRVS